MAKRTHDSHGTMNYVTIKRMKTAPASREQPQSSIRLVTASATAARRERLRTLLSAVAAALSKRCAGVRWNGQTQVVSLPPAEDWDETDFRATFGIPDFTPSAGVASFLDARRTLDCFARHGAPLRLFGIAHGKKVELFVSSVTATYHASLSHATFVFSVAEAPVGPIASTSKSLSPSDTKAALLSFEAEEIATTPSQLSASRAHQSSLYSHRPVPAGVAPVRFKLTELTPPTPTAPPTQSSSGLELVLGPAPAPLPSRPAKPPLTGKTFLFAGEFSRPTAQLERRVRDLGGEVTSGAEKARFFVLGHGQTYQQYVLATQLGRKVLNEEKFDRMTGQRVEKHRDRPRVRGLETPSIGLDDIELIYEARSLW